jgi:hypothetical protein
MGWKNKVSFHQLVDLMADSDLERESRLAD